MVLVSGEFTGPPPTREPVVVQLAFWQGEAFIAPIGSVAESEGWRRVASLDEAADRVGVEWTVKP